jgi:hypothetical protein
VPRRAVRNERCGPTKCLLVDSLHETDSQWVNSSVHRVMCSDVSLSCLCACYIHLQTVIVGEHAFGTQLFAAVNVLLVHT